MLHLFWYHIPLTIFRTMLKRLTYVLVLLSLLVSCDGYGVRKIYLTPASAEIAIGETLRLDYTIEPEGTTPLFPLWESSNPSIAQIKDFALFGEVTGIAEGTCTITAGYGCKKGVCEITVYKPIIHVERVVLSNDVLDLKKTDTKKLEAYIIPSNTDETTVTWKSEDPSVATVDETGLVTAIGVGITQITATCEGISAICEVSVWEHGGLKVECVDLGLSVDWCTTDLGASRPEELGDFYAWGEVKTKSFFDWSNYAFYQEQYRQLTKYCSDSSLGHTDGLRQLEPTDDVAYRLIEEDYRIPSSAQWVELLENCTWEAYLLGDVKGYKVSSKSYPDRWIFLPYGDSVSGVIPSTIQTYRGVYWTASRMEFTGMSRFAWTVMFYYNRIDRFEAERCDGARIRPIRLKN